MKRRHNAKFWLMMTALGFVGGVSLVGFRFSGLNAERAHVNALQAQTQNESEVQAGLTKSQQDLDDAKSKLTHLEQGIPTTAYMPTMLQQLAKTGNDCGIAVTGVRPVVKTTQAAAAQSSDASHSVEKPAYQEQDIEVKGEGNYASVMKFVTALQTFPKIVGVYTIDITPATDPKEAEQGLVDVTVGLRAYLFQDNSSNGSNSPQQVNQSAQSAKGAV